jgi:hypothetical protein
MKLLFDEDVRNVLIRGLRERLPDVELTRVQDVGLRTRPDEEVLEWAIANDYMLVTHDISTMKPRYEKKLGDGEHMPALIVVIMDTHIRRAIDELEVWVVCSKTDEQSDRVVFIPLS